MSLLRKLFGGGDPLEPLRRSSRQKAWADVLARGESLDPDRLDPSARDEFEKLVYEAGDALAELNLFEAEACLRSGNKERAAEHLALAAAQARSEGIKQRISGSRSAPGRTAPPAAPIPVPVAKASSCCPSGCGSGGGHSEAHAKELDEAVRMELIVTAYPPEWARRYGSLHGHLRRAVLLAHEGEESEALEAFDQVPVSDRDDLFHFERGAVLARRGNVDQARQDLENALAINPEHLLARETLIDIDFARGDLQAAEARLQTLLDRGEAPGFAYGRLAAIEASRGQIEAALAHGRQALACGSDPQVVLLTAALLERDGNAAEAEAVLGRLPTGCGGQNVPLAEFWIRHGKNLEKALAAVQGALRHEPDNPRWRVRIAQIYFAQGRRAEAAHLLTQALDAPSLDPEMRQEAESLIEDCRSDTNP